MSVTRIPQRTVLSLSGPDELVLEHRSRISTEDLADLELAAARLYDIACRAKVMLLAVGPADNITDALDARDTLTTLQRTLRNANVTISLPDARPGSS